jgi:hypothetical protein
VSQEERLHGADVPRPRHIHHVSLAARHDVDPERRLVIVTFGKKLTVKDIERYAAILRANPIFQPSFSEIADLSQVEEIDLQADEFIRLADQIDPFSTDARRAFVARTSIQNHAARMHKILRTQRNIEIFRTVAEATRWIMT